MEGSRPDSLAGAGWVYHWGGETMPRRMWVGCLALLVVVSGGMARGAFLTQTAQWSGNGGASFDKFNSSLGTLDSVSFSAKFTNMELSFVVENETGDAQAFGASFMRMVYAGIQGVASMQQTGEVWYPKLAPRQLTIGANATVAYGPYSTSLDGLNPDRLWSYSSDAATLADVTGTGTLVVGVGGPVGTLTLSGNIPSGALTTVNFLHDWDVEVTLGYVYSPFGLPPAPSVPEPSSLALVGVGIAGLLGAGWRRRRRVAG